MNPLGLPDYKISQAIAQSACRSLTCCDKIVKLMKKIQDSREPIKVLQPIREEIVGS